MIKDSLTYTEKRLVMIVDLTVSGKTLRCAGDKNILTFMTSFTEYLPSNT